MPAGQSHGARAKAAARGAEEVGTNVAAWAGIVEGSRGRMTSGSWPA